MTARSLKEPPRGARHRGPPLLVLAAVHTLFFVAGLVATTLLAGGEHFPSPFQAEGISNGFFALHADAVRIGAFLQLCAAIPLGLFTATAVSRLRFLGMEVAPGPMIALFGGFGASTLLALSALVQWTLAGLGADAAPSVVRTLHLLSFGLGGPGYVALLGLLIAGLAITAGLPRLVPRSWMVAGLMIASLAELSTLALVLPAAAYLLPIVRFPGFVWLLGFGAVLPRTRRKGGGEVATPRPELEVRSTVAAQEVAS